MLKSKIKIYGIYIVSVTFFLCSVRLVGQQTICFGSIKRYSVDILENSGKGSLGSKYHWRVQESSFIGAISNFLPETTNDIYINWGKTPPGVYHLNVSEIDEYGCKGIIKELEVTILPLPFTDLSKGFICLNPLTKELVRPAILDTKLKDTDYSFQWNFNGFLIGNNSSIQVSDIGDYLVKIQNLSTGCESIYPVSVALSSGSNAKIKVDNFFEDNQTIVISVINGIGDYEYSIDGSTFQDSSVFNVVKGGVYTIIIRDKNGCEDETLQAHIVTYPKFFTPNNDGYLDLWTIDGLTPEMKATISIFNRFNQLLKIIRYGSSGWDGTLNGINLPSDDYWFVIEYTNTEGVQAVFRSNFSLVR